MDREDIIKNNKLLLISKKELASAIMIKELKKRTTSFLKSLEWKKALSHKETRLLQSVFLRLTSLSYEYLLKHDLSITFHL